MDKPLICLFFLTNYAFITLHIKHNSPKKTLCSGSDHLQFLLRPADGCRALNSPALLHVRIPVEAHKC